MATIIKSGTRPGDTPHGPLATFGLADMTQRAQEILHSAGQQADRMLAQAEQEAESIRQRAWREGVQRAQQAAAQQVREDRKQDLQSAAPAVGQFVDDLQQARRQWIRQWETNVIHLAAAIAARIMRREARQDPQITMGLIREALELAADSGEVTLQLNPEDYETLQPDLKQLHAELGKLGPAAIVPDPQVTSAGCRVQTRFGTIDQQIEAQLARIEEELDS